jgi:hypothetical protein
VKSAPEVRTVREFCDQAKISVGLLYKLPESQWPAKARIWARVLVLEHPEKWVRRIGVV